MRNQTMLAALLSLLLAACATEAGGGGDGSGAGDGDGIGDGSGDGSGDGGDGGGDETGDGDEGEPLPERPDTCPAAAMGAIASLVEPEAYMEDFEGDVTRSLYAGIDDASDFALELWDGFGAFAEGGAAPGDYTIAGDDAGLETCGLCVFVDVYVGDYTFSYLATGGSVSLDTVDGSLAGSASGVTLQELDDAGAVRAGGCSVQIDSVSFDTPYSAAEEEEP